MAGLSSPLLRRLDEILWPAYYVGEPAVVDTEGLGRLKLTRLGEAVEIQVEPGHVTGLIRTLGQSSDQLDEAGAQVGHGVRTLYESPERVILRFKRTNLCNMLLQLEDDATPQ